MKRMRETRVDSPAAGCDRTTRRVSFSVAFEEVQRALQLDSGYADATACSSHHMISANKPRRKQTSCARCNSTAKIRDTDNYGWFLLPVRP